MSIIIETLEEIFSNIFNKSQDNKCSICLQEYNNNKTILLCGHIFHSNCISTWKQRSDTCPICRKKILIKRNFQKKHIFLSYLLLISILIFFLSLFSCTRTHSGIKTIAKKIYHLNRNIFLNIFEIIKSVLNIFYIFIKEICIIIKDCGLIIGKNIIRALKIIYYLIALIVIILLSTIMLIVNVIIDIMNLIIAIDEILFRII